VIGADKPEAAVKWLQTAHKKIRSLGLFPFGYEVVPEAAALPREYRHFLFGSYRIIYKIEGNRVVVARVIHGSRKLEPHHLEERS
jgi:plasmid stabilization system protein ParE